MKEIQFNPEDVKAVANALLAEHWYFNDGYNDYYECIHCDGQSNNYESFHDIKHKGNCPVLRARDLLTGL